MQVSNHNLITKNRNLLILLIYLKIYLITKRITMPEQKLKTLKEIVTDVTRLAKRISATYLIAT
jgi:hypothetical protein